MNLLLYFIFAIILVSSDFLLFTEESLILLCFIVFCTLSYNNLNNSINNYFNNINLKTIKKIDDFYNLIIDFFNKEISYKKKEKDVLNQFLKLKNYYLNLNNEFSNKILKYQNNKKISVLNDKLIFTLNLEKQYQKLIINIMLLKIKKLITLNLFYKNNIKIKDFFCVSKINLLEYLKKI